MCVFTVYRRSMRMMMLCVTRRAGDKARSIIVCCLGARACSRNHTRFGYSHANVVRNGCVFHSSNLYIYNRIRFSV